MRLNLNFHLPNIHALDVSQLLPEIILKMPRNELLDFELSYGNQVVPLKECCEIVEDELNPDAVLFSGHTDRLNYIASKMRTGTIIVNDGAGDWAGAEMSGGELIIHGNTRDSLGAAMKDGLIKVFGDAGDQVGAGYFGEPLGMKGGIILIQGNVGCSTGSHMRRGIIVVGGDTGQFTGQGMRAGSIIVAGKLGYGAGLGMRRGSIVAKKHAHVLPCFLRAGYIDPVWLKIYSRTLQPIEKGFSLNWMADSFTKFSGDHNLYGKGELLIHDYDK